MYKCINGQNRTQTYLFPVSLDQAVDTDNDVRVIDLFFDSQHLGEFGFTVLHTENVRLVYHPTDLLKLYIYGYLNRVRLSLSLKKECKGIEKGSADVSFIMTAYNIRRIINIIGINMPKEYLKRAFFLIFEKMVISELFLYKISPYIFLSKNRKTFLNISLNQLYLFQKLMVRIGF
jgi:transposase